MKVFPYSDESIHFVQSRSEVLLNNQSERILWQGYPSWGQFSWLYFLSFWTASRGMIFVYAGVPGWKTWIIGAGFLLGVAGVLRYWAKYVLTSLQVIIQNRFTGKIIRNANYDAILAVEVMQGPIAKFLGIGTVVIQCHDSNRTLRFLGVKDPETLAVKLRALLPTTTMTTR